MLVAGVRWASRGKDAGSVRSRRLRGRLRTPQPAKPADERSEESRRSARPCGTATVSPSPPRPRNAKAREPLAQFPGFDARNFSHRAHARQGEPMSLRPGDGRSCDTPDTRRLKMSTVTSKLNISKVGRVCVTVPTPTGRSTSTSASSASRRSSTCRWARTCAGSRSPGLRRGDDDRARPAAAGPGGGRQPDRDHPRQHRPRWADRATLKAAGADVDDEITRFGGPVPPMFWLRDPDGNSLIVVQPSTADHHVRSADGRLPGAPPASDGGAPRPRAARALGAARPLRATRDGRATRTAGRAAGVEEERQLDDPAL